MYLLKHALPSAIPKANTSARIRHTALFALPLLFLGLSAPGVAAEALTIATPTFAEGAIVPTPVRMECQLPEVLASSIASYVPKKRFDPVQTSNQGGSGKVLAVEIRHVRARGGGGWGGPKQVTISGTLVEGDKTIGSFIGQRGSTGGFFGGFRDTCSIVHSCAKALGKDIGRWLKAPSINSRIGELE